MRWIATCCSSLAVLVLLFVPGRTDAATVTTDPACIQAGLSVADCTIQTGMALGTPRHATVAEAKALRTAPLNATCRWWSQYMGTPVWRERHEGVFCYTGRRAAVWSWGGYHKCHTGGYGIGWTREVNQNGCYLHRVDNLNVRGGYYIQNWERFDTCYIIKLGPLCFSRNMHVNVFPSGRIRAHHDFFP